MKNPLVSVILPVHNGEQYVGEAVDSVLSQDYAPIELVVINDGSKDRTADILSRFGTSLRCIHQDNSGTAAARNRGINNTSGGYLAFIDQDDIWETRKTSLQMQKFSINPLLEMVLSYVELIYASDISPGRKRPGSSSSNLVPGYTPSALLVKKSAFLNVGYFDSRWIIGEWVDWYLRSVEQELNESMILDYLVKKRIHQFNKGLIHIDKNREYLQILKEHLDRKRNNVRSSE